MKIFLSCALIISCAFAVNAAEPGEMTYVHTVRNAPKGAAATAKAPVLEDLVHPTAAAVSPDGRNLYVITENGGALLAFSREPATGIVAYIGSRKNGTDRVTRMSSPLALLVTPNGNHVIVASNAEGSLTTFLRRPNTGEPLFVTDVAGGQGAVTGLDGVRALAFSPDGSELYALARGGDALSAFALNDSGALSFKQALRESIDGVAGLRAPDRLAVSADGRHLYAASFLDDTLTLVERDATGTLAVRGPAILGAAVPPNPVAIAISPDGAFVYLVSFKENELTVYARDPNSGVLTESTAADSGASGFEALAQPTAMSMSPDGRYAYIAGIGKHTISSFSRDSLTGQLAPLQSVAMGQAGIDGLNGPVALSMSPDNGNLYVLCRGDNSMVVFSIDSDGDGIPNQAERIGDTDADGVADYLDPQ